MRTSIIFSFIYILVYSFVLNYSTPAITFAMVLGWPFIMFWVVYTILKDKNKPIKKFEDYFYQDEDIRRLH